MYQHKLTESFVGRKAISQKASLGILAHMEINYHELQCIEIALIGFEECLQTNRLPKEIAKHDINHLYAQLNYLKHWLNKPSLRAQLRLDGRNTVLWPFTSFEQVQWLKQIVEQCVTEDAIIILASDAASCENDEYANYYLESDEDYSHSLKDNMHYCHFVGFRDYYNEIVKSSQMTVVNKLEAIHAQRYRFINH